jgi:hypothetical protein
VKLALFWLYVRLFKPSIRTRHLVYAGIVVVVLFYVSSLASALALCLPRAGQGGWTSPATLLRCEKPMQNLSSVQGIFNAISDFYVLALPLQLVWQLKMSSSRKLGVSAIFMTGLV